MKFILILACLSVYVATLEAQRTCKGAVPDRLTICVGSKNVGRNNTRSCRQNANSKMWWYDSRSRSCKKLAYKGCGGNNNRYCTRQACRNKCRRN
ncbi:kunitz-type serine protease inhibitor homolog beta-bungarotoxin B5-B chain-like [Drosophila hydei]|uniref:Kunitz-type serine protease inhibitor homolog beta-bungarotoxin B5-B chain-like n=1 Tax=Drosophila hydei TaxID=7224 RepID=A0A6J1M8G1_DROHY|nr:kunitz-type serine protease inhibitor homolog beta-bungarotoxin B5-B chain-like [Drosophila hydei]